MQPVDLVLVIDIGSAAVTCTDPLDLPESISNMGITDPVISSAATGREVADSDTTV